VLHKRGVGWRNIGKFDLNIIEVTSGKGRKKAQQIQRLLHNYDLNPTGKPVVMFGPQVRRWLVRQLEESGASVVQTLSELEAWVGQQ
jgi:hypothetical protein